MYHLLCESTNKNTTNGFWNVYCTPMENKSDSEQVIRTAIIIAGVLLIDLLVATSL